MTDPAFTPSQRKALLAQYADRWQARARCIDMKGYDEEGEERFPGQLWAPMFMDDIGAKPDPDDYSWPQPVLRAMRACAECPVRRECLEATFAETGQYRRQFGVRAGIPGRVREALGFRRCRECSGRGYHATAKVGDLVLRFKDWEWVYQQPEGLEGEDGNRVKERVRGFGCVPCEGTGKVPSKTRVRDCARWFDSYSRRQRWVVPEKKERTA